MSKARTFQCVNRKWNPTKGKETNFIFPSFQPIAWWYKLTMNVKRKTLKIILKSIWRIIFFWIVLSRKSKRNSVAFWRLIWLILFIIFKVLFHQHISSLAKAFRFNHAKTTKRKIDNREADRILIQLKSNLCKVRNDFRLTIRHLSFIDIRVSQFDTVGYFSVLLLIPQPSCCCRSNSTHQLQWNVEKNKVSTLISFAWFNIIFRASPAIFIRGDLSDAAHCLSLSQHFSLSLSLPNGHRSQYRSFFNV